MEMNACCEFVGLHFFFLPQLFFGIMLLLLVLCEPSTFCYSVMYELELPSIWLLAHTSRHTPCETFEIKL